MEQQEKYARAKKRVNEIKSFYSHLFTYAAIMVLLIVIDFRDAGNVWFYWPLMGWGMLIVSHAVRVFGLGGFLGPKWEQKKMQKEMARMNSSVLRQNENTAMLNKPEPILNSLGL